MFGAAHRRRVPHIYSEEEILALLEACETLTPIGVNSNSGMSLNRGSEVENSRGMFGSTVDGLE